MAMHYKLPLWLKNIDSALEFDNVFVIHGQEIKDDVVLPKDETRSFDDIGYVDLGFRSFPESLKYILARKGFDALIGYDTNRGFVIESLNKNISADSIKSSLSSELKVNLENQAEPFFEHVPKLINGLNNENIARTFNYAVMVDCYSEIDPNDKLASTHPNVEQMMLASYQLAKTKIDPFLHNSEDREIFSKHPVFWVVKDTSVLPSFLLSGIGIRQISIAAPSLDDRNLAIGVASYPYIPYFSESREMQEKWMPLFEKAAKAMSGLSVMAIEEISQSKMRSFKIDTEPELIINTIINTAKEYRVGLTENPWSTVIVKSRIENGIAILSESVKGQDYAIRKSVDILKMAALNINGIDSKDAGTAPRGCLFFAGPTGVGKTELAKQIAKLVFGSEDDMIRFDMSEFAEGHNAARLVGSPPGYKGNEQGGELTNKVKAKPFSLVLFDEIEKADDSIFDKFLQILSDGRLTDGRGDTVYFSETIIVFTSNKGVTEMQTWATENPDSDTGLFRHQFKGYIEKFFKDMNRPEVFGRIDEDNIIVFNTIDHDVAVQIAELGISNIIDNVLNQHQVKLVLSEIARSKIIAKVTDAPALLYGGRGVKNALRKVLVKPLTKPLMAIKQTAGKEMTIRDLEDNDDLIELVI
jgi:energy-coupling factor transporter ATP-binding protein EcfA2